MSDDVLDELFSIRGKTAVITGGTRGIGLMMAEAYVRAGVKVYVSSRKADVCAEVAERLSEARRVHRHPRRPVDRGRVSSPRRRDRVP